MDQRRKLMKKVRQGLRKCPGHRGFKDCYDETGKCTKCGGYQKDKWYLYEEDEESETFINLYGNKLKLNYGRSNANR